MYSTCTVTLAENEEQVAWALATFPQLTLQPQVKVFWLTQTHTCPLSESDPPNSSFFFCLSQDPHIGAEGMLGAGLSPEQLRLLQRFSPELSWDQADTPTSLPCKANRDTIGFFIAKFLKN